MRSKSMLWLPVLSIMAALSLASCGGAGGGSGSQDAQETTPAGAEAGTTTSAEASRRAVSPDGEYTDTAFVEAMIPHHEGAIEMAEVAPENAEHEEIRTLAREIIGAQRTEIEELNRIQDGLGGSTMEMSGEDMGGMSMSSPDPRTLAEAWPFDRAFIDAMTPHHEAAIEMAKVALEESENPEIRRIAGDIISGQERELSQMRQWREEWYPEG